MWNFKVIGDLSSRLGFVFYFHFMGGGGGKVGDGNNTINEDWKQVPVLKNRK